MQIETARLVIRPFAAPDLPAFERLLDIEEVPGWRLQKADSLRFLRWQISNYARMDITGGVVCFGSFERATGRLLGAVGAGEHDDLHETEIFYNLLASERGHGYAAEACAAVTAWALANYGIPWIIGTAEVSNVRSQRVLERCGYRFVEERELLVHLLNERRRFRYYRHGRHSLLGHAGWRESVAGAGPGRAAGASPAP